MSEEEVTCPKERLEEHCRQSATCLSLLERYEKCGKRVASRPGTSETCAEELFDLAKCVDQCVHQFKFRNICRLQSVYLNISSNYRHSHNKNDLQDESVNCKSNHWPSGMADSDNTPSQWSAVKLRAAEAKKIEAPIAPTIEENVYSAVKLRSAPKPADYDNIEAPRQEKTSVNENTSGETFKLRSAPKPADYDNVDCHESKQQSMEASTNSAYEEVRARLKKVQQQQ